jgi:hypothetical protein
LKKLYISLTRKTTKHIITEKYEKSSIAASDQRRINTISLTVYARAKYGLLLKHKKAAIKLVVTDNVLGRRLALPSARRIKKNIKVTIGVSIISA